MGLFDSQGSEAIASPTPDTTIARSSPISTPISATKGVTWDDILKAVTQMGGGGNQLNFGNLMSGANSNANRGIPLYTPPLQAMPMEDEQKKQTSVGEAEQYAKIIAGLFGGGDFGMSASAGAAASGFGGGGSF